MIGLNKFESSILSGSRHSAGIEPLRVQNLKFNGQEVSYRPFKVRFNRLMKGVDQDLHAEYLVQCLDGEALRLAMMHIEDSIQDIWSFLDWRYGNDVAVYQLHSRKLLEIGTYPQCNSVADLKELYYSFKENILAMRRISGNSAAGEDFKSVLQEVVTEHLRRKMVKIMLYSPHIYTLDNLLSLIGKEVQLNHLESMVSSTSHQSKTCPEDTHHVQSTNQMEISQLPSTSPPPSSIPAPSFPLQLSFLNFPPPSLPVTHSAFQSLPMPTLSTPRSATPTSQIPKQSFEDPGYPESSSHYTPDSPSLSSRHGSPHSKAPPTNSIPASPPAINTSPRSQPAKIPPPTSQSSSTPTSTILPAKSCPPTNPHGKSLPPASQSSHQSSSSLLKDDRYPSLIHHKSKGPIHWKQKPKIQNQVRPLSANKTNIDVQLQPSRRDADSANFTGIKKIDNTPEKKPISKTKTTVNVSTGDKSQPRKNSSVSESSVQQTHNTSTKLYQLILFSLYFCVFGFVNKYCSLTWPGSIISVRFWGGLVDANSVFESLIQLLYYLTVSSITVYYSIIAWSYSAVLCRGVGGTAHNAVFLSKGMGGTAPNFKQLYKYLISYDTELWCILYQARTAVRARQILSTCLCEDSLD